jgi:hypothetical protein
MSVLIRRSGCKREKMMLKTNEKVAAGSISVRGEKKNRDAKRWKEYK